GLRAPGLRGRAQLLQEDPLALAQPSRHGGGLLLLRPRRHLPAPAAGEPDPARGPRAVRPRADRLEPESRGRPPRRGPLLRPLRLRPDAQRRRLVDDAVLHALGPAAVPRLSGGGVECLPKPAPLSG